MCLGLSTLDPVAHNGCKLYLAAPRESSSAVDPQNQEWNWCGLLTNVLDGILEFFHTESLLWRNWIAFLILAAPKITGRTVVGVARKGEGCAAAAGRRRQVSLRLVCVDRLTL